MGTPETERILDDSRSLDRPAWKQDAGGWDSYKHKHPTGKPILLNYYEKSKGQE